jgi:hypothetical protein
MEYEWQEREIGMKDLIKCGVIILSIMISSLTARSAWSQSFWWESEYQDLIKTVQKAKNSQISTSYKTGPEGQHTVGLSLQKLQEGSLILRMTKPKRSMATKDSKTGEMIPSKVTPVVIIRDHNLDGFPEDYVFEPRDKFQYSGTGAITKDGFIQIRNVPEDRAVLMEWAIGIGFSVNHFLHGVNSAFPK